MIEAAAPAGTITQAFSWPPPASEVGAALSESPPTYAPGTTLGCGDGDRKRSRQVIDRLRVPAFCVWVTAARCSTSMLRRLSQVHDWARAFFKFNDKCTCGKADRERIGC